MIFVDYTRPRIFHPYTQGYIRIVRVLKTEPIKIKIRTIFIFVVGVYQEIFFHRIHSIQMITTTKNTHLNKCPILYRNLVLCMLTHALIRQHTNGSLLKWENIISKWEKNSRRKKEKNTHSKLRNVNISFISTFITCNDIATLSLFLCLLSSWQRIRRFMWPAGSKFLLSLQFKNRLYSTIFLWHKHAHDGKIQFRIDYRHFKFCHLIAWTEC